MARAVSRYGAVRCAFKKWAFCTIERPRGTVGVTALGEDRHVVTAPQGEHTVAGHDATMDAAHRLAGELG